MYICIYIRIYRPVFDIEDWYHSIVECSQHLLGKALKGHVGLYLYEDKNKVLCHLTLFYNM